MSESKIFSVDSLPERHQDGRRFDFAGIKIRAADYHRENAFRGRLADDFVNFRGFGAIVRR